MHECRAALNLYRAEKRGDTARKDGEHFTRITSGVIFFDADPDSITARQANRRARRQKNALLLPFDTNERETRAVGRHHTFHRARAGSAATTRGAPRRFSAGPGAMLH